MSVPVMSTEETSFPVYLTIIIVAIGVVLLLIIVGIVIWQKNKSNSSTNKEETEMNGKWRVLCSSNLNFIFPKIRIECQSIWFNNKHTST